ncbi:MAG: ABC transporter permease [Nanoarchaeota archaeon]|nr:ABC transporter permease [Nanoarchaeota archaeon]
MIGIESIRYSLRNIAHRKSRSFLTILSIFLGIATIFVFISFGLGLYGYINGLIEGGSADKIMVQAKGGMGVPGLDDTFRLEDSDVRAIERSAGVEEATGVYMKVAQVEFKNEMRYVYLMGYDPKVPIVLDLADVDIHTGRELESSDTGNVVLGYGYLIKDRVFSKTVSLGDNIEVQDRKLRVVGFFDSIGSPPDDSSIYVVDEAVDEIYNESENSYGWIVARVDPDNVDWIVSNIERNLRKSRDLEEGKEDFTVQGFAAMVESYAGAMNIIVGFVILIALISVVVSAVNTANTMITSVIERTKEIGVIKSIGGKNSEVFGIFLFESAFLGLVAGGVGVLLGWGLAAFGGMVLDNLGWGFLAPVFPYYLFVGLISFAVITGALSGAIPAWKASRINIVDALRYE